MKDACTLLREGREFLADEEHFCTGWYAEKEDGDQRGVFPHMEEAAKCCGAGAIWRALGEDPWHEDDRDEDYDQAIIRLGMALGADEPSFGECHLAVIATNDGPDGWRRIVKGYDKALEACEEPGEGESE